MAKKMSAAQRKRLNDRARERRIADEEELAEKERALMERLAPPEEKNAIQLVEEPEEIAVEDIPGFSKAFQVAMDLFEQFIVYELDAPEEPRIMLFPAFMHIKTEDINAEIVQKYSPKPGGPPLEVSPGRLENLKIIQEGIMDSIGILRQRTNNAFPMPGERALRQIEYETLSNLAAIETRLFYRVTADDLLVGHIKLTQNPAHSIRANQPLGTRFRSWVSVDAFTRIFHPVLADDSHEDMVTALIAYDRVVNAAYERYFMRWREAELI